MKAIILAAGRGKRMRPLSDTTPKPLLEVHGKPLIEWHLEALARGGVREIVVNTAWLEEQIVATLGDGSRFGVAIAYSREGRDHGGALETAGGIAKALPLLGDAFWIVSADVWAPDFRFDAGAAARFVAERPARRASGWCRTRSFHPRGDFGLDADGLGLAEGTGPDGQRWTYANIALARAEMFAGIAPGTHAALAPLLYAGMRERRIGAEIYRGRWENVGTPEQLAALNAAPTLRRAVQRRRGGRAIASMRATTSGVSRGTTSTASRLARSWPTFDAPVMTVETRGFFSDPGDRQLADAGADLGGDRPRAWSTAAFFASSVRPLASQRMLSSAPRLPAGMPFRYLPVSRPLASGLQVVRPRPMSS